MDYPGTNTNDLEWVWRLLLLRVTKRIAQSLCICRATCCVIAGYCLKSPILTYPTCIWCHLRVTLFQFCPDYNWCQKTTVPVPSCGVVCMILSLTVLTQYRRVTDRQTDGRTHDDSLYRASIASRGKNQTRSKFIKFSCVCCLSSYSVLL